VRKSRKLNNFYPSREGVSFCFGLTYGTHRDGTWAVIRRELHSAPLSYVQSVNLTATAVLSSHYYCENYETLSKGFKERTQR
jgi:hypothetical protein